MCRPQSRRVGQALAVGLGLALSLVPSCSRAPQEGTPEPVGPAQAVALTEGQGDPLALGKSLTPGMTSNAVAAVLGAPPGIFHAPDGISVWGYSLQALPAKDRQMQGMIISDLVLVFTNGLLSDWSYGRTPVDPRPQEPAPAWSDLAVVATNAGSASISFSVVSELAFPGSRLIDTVEVPKAGYVARVPDLEVTQVRNAVSGLLPVAAGREEGARGFRVWFTPTDGERLAALTLTNVGRRLVVFAGAEPVMAPVLNEPLLSSSMEIQCQTVRTSERLQQVLQAMPRRER